MTDDIVHRALDAAAYNTAVDPRKLLIEAAKEINYLRRRTRHLEEFIKGQANNMLKAVDDV